MLKRQLKLLSRFAKKWGMERKKLWEGKEGTHINIVQGPKYRTTPLQWTYVTYVDDDA